MKTPKSLIPLATLSLLVAFTGCGSTKSSEPAETSVGTSATAMATSQTATSASASPTATSSPTQTTAAPTPSVSESPEPVPTGTVITVEPSATPSPADESTLATGQAPSSMAGVAVCDYDQLYIEAAVAPGGGAAGSRYINLTFTNTGSAPCSIGGYPAVHYVNSAGQQIGASAANATDLSSSGGVLATGESLTAILREIRAGLYADRCQSVAATGYSIQAPGASQALVLNFASEACSNTDITQLTVGAVGAAP